MLTKAVTWGMPNDERKSIVAECVADWDAMHTDRGGLAVVFRAVRGIPAAFLTRMDDRRLTALPAGFVVAAIGAIAVIAGYLDRTYPNDLRLFIAVFGAGLALTGVALLRTPRSVALRRLRWPAFVTAVGLIGMAATMPAESEWRYDTPVVDTVLGDVLMVTGFLTAAIGGLILFAASYKVGSPQLPLLAGGAFVAGAGLFGTGFIVWGVVAASTDLTITATAVGAGLGTYSLVHVLPRLRHLDRS